MTEQEREINRVIRYIRSCREAGIDTTITIDKGRNHFILNALEEVLQYRSIGTVEECRTAMEKQKVVDYKEIRPCKSVTYYQCPICDGLLHIDENFCGNCGQAISWNESED